MNIYVLDSSFNTVDIIDDYLSLIWTSRYYSAGDFELYVSAYEKALRTLVRGRYLVRDRDIVSGDEFHHVMRIENIELVTDEEDGNRLIVTGSDLKGILQQRVISSQTTLNGTAANGIKTLIQNAITSPSVSARTISNFTFGTDVNLTAVNIDRQFTGDNLAEAVTDICINAEYGYDIYLKNGSFVFYLYQGEDRSFEQNTNPYIVFSDEYDNLLSSDYIVDGTSYRNVVYVAGEGEGTARKIVPVGTASGLSRYEMWLDSRNTSSNEGAITAAEYTKLLQQEGREALTEAAMVTTFEGEVINTNLRNYGEDFFLGDLVQVENEYQISAKVRIIEAIESEDENGENLVMSFSEMEVQN